MRGVTQTPASGAPVAADRTVPVRDAPLAVAGVAVNAVTAAESSVDATTTHQSWRRTVIPPIPGAVTDGEARRFRKIILYPRSPRTSLDRLVANMPGWPPERTAGIRSRLHRASNDEAPWGRTRD